MTVFDATNGSIKFTTANTGTSLSPTAFFNGHVLTTGAYGMLRAYNVATCVNGCAPEWTANLGAATTQAPAVGLVGGTYRVFATTSGGTILGYTTNGCGASSCNPTHTGAAPHGRAATSRPIIRNGVVLATFGNDLVSF